MLPVLLVFSPHRHTLSMPFFRFVVYVFQRKRVGVGGPQTAEKKMLSVVSSVSLCVGRHFVAIFARVAGSSGVLASLASLEH